VLSIVQTSYRAEVRAILQVLARCKADVLICSDCKSVVNQVQDYLTSRRRNILTAAPELWEVIHDLLEEACDADNNHIAIKWVPSHLDDEKKLAKREKYLAAGDITLHDIDGNVAADAQAERGTNAHGVDPFVLATVKDAATYSSNTDTLGAILGGMDRPHQRYWL
jgi:hypothetical protein